METWGIPSRRGRILTDRARRAPRSGYVPDVTDPTRPSSQPWTEAALQDLGPDEYDWQEYKGTGLVHRDGVINSEFQGLLSKQVGAFANGGGGRVFLGLDDEGRIDGGVPVDLKRGGTRSWLEDIIAGLVDPPLAAFNVHEVRAEQPGSPILPGHAVYVIEVAASDMAPHQSMDHRYYLRIAGKSRPMGHVHLQDVLGRTRHPQLVVERVDPYGPAERITTDARGPKAIVCVRLYATNKARRLAQHAGLEVEMPRPLVTRDVRKRMLGEEDVGVDQRPGSVSFFRHHPTPIFPGQTVRLFTAWMSVHGGNVDAIASGQVRISWKAYADDAPFTVGSWALRDAAVVREAVRWLRASAPAEAKPAKSPKGKARKEF